MNSGWRDLSEGVRRLPTAWALALSDVRGRYSRSTLGPLWLTVAQGFWIAGIYLVFGQIIGQGDPGFLLYLAAGLSLWPFIASTLVSSLSTLVWNKETISAYPAPLSLYVFRAVFVQLLEMAHLLVAFVGAAWLGGYTFSWWLLAFPAAIVLFALSSTGVGLAFSVLGARFRDLAPAVGSVMGLMFLVTPVVWRLDVMTPGRRYVAELNPLHHYIDIGRGALTGEGAPIESWLYCGISTIVLLVGGAAIFAWRRKDIYFWL